MERKGYIGIHRIGFNSTNIYKLLVLPEDKDLDKSFDKVFGGKITQSNSKVKNSRSKRQKIAEPTSSVLPPNKTNINKHEHCSKKTKKNRKSSFSSIKAKTTTLRKKLNERKK